MGDDLEKRIDELTADRAVFCLKALLLTGHVSEHLMGRTLDICDAVRFEP